MPPTARYLLAALRDPADRDNALLAELGEAEWDDVAQLAMRQRVAPLLYSRPGLPFPADVRATLQARAQRSAFRVLRQQAAFRELADAVAPMGIQLMVLKGLHLATSVYPSAGLREMADIDLLVRPDDLQAVTQMATRLGYAHAAGSIGDALHHLPPLTRNNIAFELHYQLLPPTAACPPKTTGLFDRSQPVGTSANVVGLCPEDLIVHICVHAAGNHVLEMGLRPLCDLQAIVQQSRSQIDWPTVVARAAEWRCQRSVMLMLLLARDHLGVPIPSSVFTSAPGSLPSADLLDVALSAAVAGAGELAAKSPTAAQLLRLPGPIAKVRYIVSQIFRPSAEQAAASPHLRMSRWARARHVVERAIGVTRRHGSWLWRASRERDGSLRQALDRRGALVDWIREG